MSEAFAEAWRLVPGRADHGRHQRQPREAARRRRRRLARVRVRARAADRPARSPALRRRVDGRRRAREGDGARGRLQRRRRSSSPSAPTRRRPSGASTCVLEPYGGLGAVGRADQPSAKLVDQKIAQLAQDGEDAAAHIPRRRRVPAERPPLAHRRDAARADRHAEGARATAPRELLRHYLELAVAICALGVVVRHGCSASLGAPGSCSRLCAVLPVPRLPLPLRRLDGRRRDGRRCCRRASAGSAARRAPGRRDPSCGGHAARGAAELPARPRLDRVYRGLSPRHAHGRSATRSGGRCGSSSRRPPSLWPRRSSSPAASSATRWTEVLRAPVRGLAPRGRSRSRWTSRAPWRAVARGRAHPRGCVHAEGERMVPVRLRAGHRDRGPPPSSACARARPPPPPRRGQAPARASRRRACRLSRPLGESLGVRRGRRDRGSRSSRRTGASSACRVAALVDDLLGLSGYMDASELARLLGETPRVERRPPRGRRSDLDAVMQRLAGCPRSRR